MLREFCWIVSCQWHRIGVVVAACALVSACGGGGGGGGSSGDNSAYTLSASAVTFNAMQGGAAPAPQVIQINVNGTVFVGTSQAGGNFSHVFEITGTTTGQITITPDAPVNAGTSTGVIS